jgi:hypothetical protein
VLTTHLRSMPTTSVLLLLVTGVLLLGLLGAAHGARGFGTSTAAAAGAADIDPHAAYEPQTTCEASEQPGAKALRGLVLEQYPGTRDGGILRSCDEGGRSEHKDGRAWDWMVDADDPGEAAKAEELLAWLLATDEDGNEHAMARRLGVMYVIWDRRIWSAARAGEGWRPYRGPHPHTDHVHVSLSRAGGAMQTSYWTNDRDEFERLAAR